ncbi:MAG: hypothetical protein HY913_18825 [Desulfomonile tiedjei]|nr:hypothetical protein [Desulfomonile tiedjei]
MMTKITKGERKKFRTLDEFEKEYFPNLHERKILEAEREEPTLFVQRLVAPLFDNIKRELTKR